MAKNHILAISFGFKLNSNLKPVDIENNHHVNLFVSTDSILLVSLSRRMKKCCSFRRSVKTRNRERRRITLQSKQNILVSKFAKFGLVKGRTFANPAAHPYPNYTGVPPGGGSDKHPPAISNYYWYLTSPFFIRKNMVKIFAFFHWGGSPEPPEPPLDPPQTCISVICLIIRRVIVVPLRTIKSIMKRMTNSK